MWISSSHSGIKPCFVELCGIMWNEFIAQFFQAFFCCSSLSLPFFNPYWTLFGCILDTHTPRLSSPKAQQWHVDLINQASVACTGLWVTFAMGKFLLSLFFEWGIVLVEFLSRKHGVKGALQRKCSMYPTWRIGFFEDETSGSHGQGSYNIWISSWDCMGLLASELNFRG